MKRAVFMDKAAATVLQQSKRTVLETGLPFAVEVLKRNAELLGVLPYMFCFGAYAFENFKDLVIDAPGITHYQLGTEADPIPLSVLYKYTIGSYTEQKAHLHTELYRFMQEKRLYYLPSKAGGHILDEPVRIVPVTKAGRVLPPKQFYTLVSRQAGGEYHPAVKEAVAGFILHYFKPLFEGHFNGWQQGFIKQPPLLYALARDYHQRLADPALPSFTPVKIVQTFYYLATHCNYKGTKITLDIPDLLKHVLESALKAEDIRYTNLPPLLGALDALKAITAEYADGFDFIVESLHLDRSDWAYADTQAAITEPDRLLCAVKHHLKSHTNTLVLGVNYTSEKAGGNRRKT